MNILDPANYRASLDKKIAKLHKHFADFLTEMPPKALPKASSTTQQEPYPHTFLEGLEIFESPPLNYRMRAEFRIWHEGDTCHYAMYRPGENNKPYVIEAFPAGSPTIVRLMPDLLAALNANPDLKRRLFCVEFLTTKSGEALITLIYHRPIDESWREPATLLSKQLGCDIIGRSRKVKIVIGRDYVIERLNVDNKSYIYQQVETGFTQPNATINEQMLSWAKRQCRNYNSAERDDLLELYCGNGNFSVALASEFRKVLATEVSKLSVKSAQYNLTANAINNVTLVRMSSEELSQAFAGARPFRRLREIDLNSYQFSTVLVDPPRAGLDAGTLELLERFETIVYISCNPETLLNNLNTLCKTHSIEAFAIFDQFPYTDHLECGVILRKYSKTD